MQKLVGYILWTVTLVVILILLLSISVWDVDVDSIYTYWLGLMLGYLFGLISFKLYLIQNQ